MILKENVGKIKRKIANVVDNFSEVSVPQKKFLIDMLFGVYATESLNLMAISRKLLYDMDIRHIHKRLQRNISNGGDLLPLINRYILDDTRDKISDDASLYLDAGDFTYQTATTYEHMTIVRDGSKKRYASGYISNLLVCRSNSEIIPLNFYVYNRGDNKFESDNVYTFDVMQKYIEVNGSKGVWVLDRGYDDKKVIQFLTDNNSRFVIRVSHTNRYVLYRDNRISIKDLCLNFRTMYKLRSGSYHYRHCYVENMPVTIIYYRNKSDLTLICSGHISNQEAKDNIDRYFNRWDVESGHRFIKQAFGLEKAQISKFNGIKCITGISMLAWHILNIIDNDKALSYITLKVAKIDKYKKVKFHYYRLINGIKAFILYLLNHSVIKKAKKTIKKQLTIEDFLKIPESSCHYT